MAIPIKAILLEKDERIGTGLTALRQKMATAIDISDYGDALSDSTSTTTHAYIIKNDKAYKVVRNFLDLDNNTRFIMAKNDENSFDRWPVG